MEWDPTQLIGPDGQDWRVPVSELEGRQKRLSRGLAEVGIESALIDDPVELYWLTGGRQNSAFLIGAEGSGIRTVQWVRRSIERARYEGGGTDCPHEIERHPRMASMFDELVSSGCNERPSMIAGKIPHDRWSFLNSKMSSLGGESEDCTGLLYGLREEKTRWEISMIRESGEINRKMFEVIHKEGGVGKSELEMAGAADEVSRKSGFGGRIRMRKWPMDCDRVVIAAGRSGAVPSYFDSAVGGLGGSPMSSLGAGFSRVEEHQPVLVDIVHVHRGYVSDCTRMFSAGKLSSEWESRLEQMCEISAEVVSSLGRGDDCSEAWGMGCAMSAEMGHSKHLMGISPNQASFLGHSVGLELDETPVVAMGFDRPLPAGGIMAVEPKVIHADGAIGIEDTWVRTSDGMECLTAGVEFPRISEW
jgi:Xaa-Pro aminopeptidase